MSDLSAIADRHGVPADAARHLLDALLLGHGRMAQFSHPALGGMGQWNAGGMIMIGDMFNNGLKARVSALCDDLLPLLAEEAAKPGAGLPGRWWPEGLGQPSSTGSQNGARYAVFPAERRLVVESDGRTTVYDTADHLIGGVSQQQSYGRSLGFSSQHGPIRLEDLHEIGGDGMAAPLRAMEQPASLPVAAPIPEAPPPPAAPFAEPPRAASAPEAPSAKAAPSESPRNAATSETDILSVLERLAELHRKGVLTEAEFSTKKTELLARL